MHDTAPNSDQEDTEDGAIDLPVPNSPVQPLVLNNLPDNADVKGEPMDDRMDESTKPEVIQL